MSEFIKFPESKDAPKTLDEFVRTVHELAKKSENVYLDHPHAKERMLERHITMHQIFDVLRYGRGIDGPTQDKYGCWRIKLERLSAGKLIQVVVVVQKKHLEVITVINKAR